MTDLFFIEDRLPKPKALKAERYIWIEGKFRPIKEYKPGMVLITVGKTNYVLREEDVKIIADEI